MELLFGPADEGRLQALTHLGRSTGLPLIAAGDVHMHTRSRRALQDTLTAIRLGCPVAEAGSSCILTENVIYARASLSPISTLPTC